MDPDPDPLGANRRNHRWWREVGYVLVFYGLYSAIRNLFGSAAVGPEHALNNAQWIIEVERSMGLFFEQPLQAAFLDWEPFIWFWNVYYGTFHFVVTAGALIWCYFRFPLRYAVWRNTLAAMTTLAIIGFALFPLMPPRLLNVPTCDAPPGPHADLSVPCSPFGGGSYADEDFGFVDTLREVGGSWSFDSGAMVEISNQFAAMPSLHIGWSTWCVFVLLPQVRRRWVKAAVVAYPLLTLFCIIVTGNHFWLDGVGGLVALAGGWAVGALLARLIHGPTPRPDLPASENEPAATPAAPAGVRPGHPAAVD